MASGQQASKAVEVEDLRVTYGGRVAVDGISFSAERGEVLAMLGPNGAGKTTTVETLEGYRAPDGGLVRVLGRDPIADRKQVVARIGVVLQRGGVYPMMSPAKVLRLFASYYPDPRDPADLIERLGLAEVARTPYKRLSGGEQQRLALALAVIGRPEVAFLDEPTAGVDPSGRSTVREMIEGLRADGVCIVLTSHELDEVERLADRVVIVDHGRVVAAGRPEELGEPGGEIRFSSAPGLDEGELARVLAAEVTELRPGQYRVAVAPTPENVASLASWLAGKGLALGSIEGGRERLEDVFLRLIRTEGGP